MKGNRLHECPICHKHFQSLGIARHRAMHTDAARKKDKETAAKMLCPNCNASVKKDDLMPSLLTSSLLCCPNCKGKSKHVAIIGTDPAAVFGEAENKNSTVPVFSKTENFF